MKFSSVILAIILLPAIARSDDATVTIAALLPLTGSVAEAGAEIKNGMMLAAEEIREEVSAKTGQQFSLRLIFEDTAFDLKQTATATRKVIEQDNADAVVTLWETSDAAAPISERSGVLHIAIRWDPAITKNRPLTFTFEPTYRSWVRSILQELSRADIKTLYLIGEENQSTEQAFSAFDEMALGFGIEVLGRDQFNPTERDFRAMLIKAIRRKPENLYLLSYPPAIELLIRQLKSIAPAQKFSGDLELVKDLSLIDGITFVSGFSSSEEFISKYRTKFGTSFSSRAPHGFEIVRLLSDAYREAPPEGRSMRSRFVAEWLSKLRNRPSVIGPITTSGERNIEHPTAIERVIGGKRIVNR